MEELLHYVWKHRLFPPKPLVTTQGDVVEVIDVGLQNHHAGPDFFNAKIKLNGTLWVGNVEIHQRASQWNAHGHTADAAYENVVLHVVEQADAQAFTPAQRPLPQLELPIPNRVKQNYAELLAADKYPPCHKIIAALPKLVLNSWMSRLQTERLEHKTQALLQRVKRCNGSWEEACFATLARSYGFGVNGDAFECWAMSMPPGTVVHHRDKLFQVEAFFMGQAGLLDTDYMTPEKREAALADSYFSALAKEYAYLRHKFNLTPMSGSRWRFLRLRPHNFPYIRLSQLAMLYHKQTATLAKLTACETVQQLHALLHTQATDYWQTHFAFGMETPKAGRRLSEASLNGLIVNAVVPLLFAYGRHRGDEALCLRAMKMLETLPPENNNIVSMWKNCGMKVAHAGDAQALIELKNEYCDRKYCLRCAIGYEYLKTT